RLDRLLVHALLLDLGQQAQVDVRALLQRPAHASVSLVRASAGAARKLGTTGPGCDFSSPNPERLVDFSRNPRSRRQLLCWNGPLGRRRRIALLPGLRFLRVFPPLASTPVFEHGSRPPAVRPSPPPIGWSTGFWLVPRLWGLRPFHRIRPALPMLMFMCSAFDTLPIVARHLLDTRRISPLGIVNCAQSFSRAVSVAEQPALRQICPPLPGVSSMLWMVMPRGTFHSGMQLPGLGSTASVSPEITLSPAFSPSGARM